MNETTLDADDTALRRLLRRSRVAPALPPRFQEGVWRRIETAAANRDAVARHWLDAVVNWLLRPKLALAGAAALMLLGAWMGVHEGAQGARQAAQARYVASVAPNALR
jgi:hypothetical protein